MIGSSEALRGAILELKTRFQSDESADLWLCKQRRRGGEIPSNWPHVHVIQQSHEHCKPHWLLSHYVGLVGTGRPSNELCARLVDLSERAAHLVLETGRVPKSLAYEFQPTFTSWVDFVLETFPREWDLGEDEFANPPYEFWEVRIPNFFRESALALASIVADESQSPNVRDAHGTAAASSELQSALVDTLAGAKLFVATTVELLRGAAWAEAILNGSAESPREWCELNLIQHLLLIADSRGELQARLGLVQTLLTKANAMVTGTGCGPVVRIGTCAASNYHDLVIKFACTLCRDMLRAASPECAIWFRDPTGGIDQETIKQRLAEVAKVALSEKFQGFDATELTARLEVESAQAAALERGEVSEPREVPYVGPYTPKQLRVMFKCNQDTLRERLKDQRIRNRRLSDKSFMIHPTDLPAGKVDTVPKSE